MSNRPRQPRREKAGKLLVILVLLFISICLVGTLGVDALIKSEASQMYGWRVHRTKYQYGDVREGLFFYSLKSSDTKSEANGYRAIVQLGPPLVQFELDPEPALR